MYSIVCFGYGFMLNMLCGLSLSIRPDNHMLVMNAAILGTRYAVSSRYSFTNTGICCKCD